MLTAMVWMVFTIAVLSLLVIVHECGHYVVARGCRIRIAWVSLGLGPAIFRRTSQTTGTTFRIGLIPFGGFVRIRGMDTADEDLDDRHAYPNRPLWQRLATILAGPTASFLLAVAIAMALYTCHGVDVPRWYGVGNVMHGYDADGKLEPGDRILAVDGAPLYIDSGPSLIERVNQGRGASITLTIERDGQQHDLQITPRPDEDASGRPIWRIGVQPVPQDLVVKLGILDAAQRALEYPVAQAREIVKALYGIVFGSEKADPGGPVRMAAEFHHAFSAGTVYGIKLVMMLSVYFGLFLALPIPFFDGGRLLFLLYRAVTRPRPRPAS